MDATAPRPPVSPEYEQARVKLLIGVRDHAIPKAMHDRLFRYVLDGRPSGIAFLNALLHGHPKSAEAYADAENRAAIYNWASLLESEFVPRACWGSPGIVGAWISMGGIAGRGDRTPIQGVPAVADRAPSMPVRLSPSVLIAQSSEAAKKLADGIRALQATVAWSAGLGGHETTSSEISAALVDLIAAQAAVDVLQCESAKAVR